MNTNVKKISKLIDDIKETLTDYQYKTIVDTNYSGYFDGIE
jgi:hypothetical protein